MKRLFFFVILLILNMNNVFSDDENCDDLKKFSVEFLKCKGTLAKDKTINTSKNIIKNTKNFQKNEWSEEKKKMIKVKEKF